MYNYGMPDISQAFMPFQEPSRLFCALWILLGLWLLNRLWLMLWYEYYFYNGAGEDFFESDKYTVERFYWERKIIGVPQEIKVDSNCLTNYYYFYIRRLYKFYNPFRPITDNNIQSYQR